MYFVVSRDSGSALVNGAGALLAIAAGHGLMWMAWREGAPGWTAALGVGIVATTLIARWWQRSRCYEVSSEAIRIRFGPFTRNIPLADVLDVRTAGLSPDGRRVRIALRVRTPRGVRRTVLSPCDPASLLRRLAMADTGFRIGEGRLHRTA